MKVKIKVVEEKEIKIPKLKNNFAHSAIACISRDGCVDCSDIACADCLFFLPNYKALKESEEL